ncbi:hypothetical protein K466DRAFT_174382 [Polyporus arcularius HHB13444]|uniref:N-acetyltransferase domain-containing protein n=1 Tax=Polyporus arcularius HHB13444 TaxID=1314778 RepID=A0A5C3PB24_9APHY|nr:hypothetical protein K466DRAFT_174382 [Polyporus arcularius HHB13444]
MARAAASDESTPLLTGEKHLDEHDVQVKPLQYRDIPRAISGATKAFANDSMMLYFKEPESSRLFHLRLWIDIAARLTDCVIRGKVNTVDHGDAFLFYGIPGDSRHKPPFSWILSLLPKLGNWEVRKRRNEFLTKAKALIETALGDQVDNLFEVQGLATVPSKQGRGYATALISVVHEMADVQGRATFVITGDAYKFYESVGYKLIGEDWFGNDNPKYHGPPGPIRLVRASFARSA